MEKTINKEDVYKEYVKKDLDKASIYRRYIGNLNRYKELHRLRVTTFSRYSTETYRLEAMCTKRYYEGLIKMATTIINRLEKNKCI